MSGENCKAGLRLMKSWVELGEAVSIRCLGKCSLPKFGEIILNLTGFIVPNWGGDYPAK